MAFHEEELAGNVQLEEPKLFKVILHNDDYTTMEFVVQILKLIFHMDQKKAEEAMWTIHKSGKTICGVYIHEIALTKAEQVKTIARENNFPLLATIESE